MTKDENIKNVETEEAAENSEVLEVTQSREDLHPSTLTTNGDSTVVNGVILEFTAQTVVEDIANSPSSENNTKKEVEENKGAEVIPMAQTKSPSAPSETQLLEAQIKLIAIFVSEAKVLEKEMNKLIKAMYAKSPESKPYLLRMKKLIQDHANIEKVLEEVKKAS